jgi:hypothetical protein
MQTNLTLKARRRRLEALASLRRMRSEEMESDQNLGRPRHLGKSRSVVALPMFRRSSPDQLRIHALAA